MNPEISEKHAFIERYMGLSPDARILFKSVLAIGGYSRIDAIPGIVRIKPEKIDPLEDELITKGFLGRADMQLKPNQPPQFTNNPAGQYFKIEEEVKEQFSKYLR